MRRIRNQKNENNIYNETLNVISSDECTSCTLYVVLSALFLTTSIIIGSSLIYFYWYKKNKQLYLKNDALDVKYSKAETLIY